MDACPNCNNNDYERGRECGECGWKPVSHEEIEKEKSKLDKQEKNEQKKNAENFTAIIGIALFFLFIFWIFPVRGASDWFHLTVGEIFSTIIICGIGAAIIFNK